MQQDSTNNLFVAGGSALIMGGFIPEVVNSTGINVYVASTSNISNTTFIGSVIDESDNHKVLYKYMCIHVNATKEEISKIACENPDISVFVLSLSSFEEMIKGEKELHIIEACRRNNAINTYVPYLKNADASGYVVSFDNDETVASDMANHLGSSFNVVHGVAHSVVTECDKTKMYEPEHNIYITRDISSGSLFIFPPNALTTLCLSPSMVLINTNTQQEFERYVLNKLILNAGHSIMAVIAYNKYGINHDTENKIFCELENIEEIYQSSLKLVLMISEKYSKPYMNDDEYVSWTNAFKMFLKYIRNSSSESVGRALSLDNMGYEKFERHYQKFFKAYGIREFNAFYSYIVAYRPK